MDFKQKSFEEKVQFSPIEDLVKDWASSPNETYTNKDIRIRRSFFTNDTEVFQMRGQKFSRTLASNTVYSMSATDYLVAITSLAVAPTIGLPKPRLVGVGKTFIIKDEVGGAATTTITIVSQGGETIDGVASTTINTAYGAKQLYTDGANWFKLTSI